MTTILVVTTVAFLVGFAAGLWVGRWAFRILAEESIRRSLW